MQEKLLISYITHFIASCLEKYKIATILTTAPQGNFFS